MVLNWAFCCGAIWRRRENRNMVAQLHFLRCTTATKLFWKIYFLYDFWCAQSIFVCGSFFRLPSRSL